MDRLDDLVGRGREEAVDQVRAPGDRFRFRAAVALKLGPDPGQREWRSVVTKREPHDVLFLGPRFDSRLYSAKLFAGTGQRASGFSQARQCGDDVLRKLVTEEPPARGGGRAAASPAPAGCPRRAPPASVRPGRRRTSGILLP
jgi:hypothetical protein